MAFIWQRVMAYLLHARKRTGNVWPLPSWNYRRAGKMTTKLAIRSVMCRLESSEGRKAK